MASILSRSSRRVRRYSRISLCFSSVHLWRSAAAKSTIDSPFKLFSSISRVSDHEMVTARGNLYEISSIFGRVFCSVPSNTNSAVSTDPVDSEKAPEISTKSDSVEAMRTHYKFKDIPRGGPITWMSFLLTMGACTSVLIAFLILKKARIEEINVTGARIIEGAGKASIGGPFSLIDHHGKPVTDNDFHGMWKLIYFGFTHCPDICPDEMQKLAAAIDKIRAKARIDVLPIFISVDPERDGVDQVREYVKEFHPKLIGLTGSLEEVTRVARSYRVYYMKAQEEDDDYLVDHSIVMFLMAPNMGFVKFFGKDTTLEELVDGVIAEIKQYK